jgi:lipooligosaccharide transport system permease protein
VDGLSYVQFVGTGTVATAVLFSSVFPGPYETFIKGEFQWTFDAILAAPMDTEELVTGEALWIATRVGSTAVCRWWYRWSSAFTRAGAC